jgi:long-chain acyl-CoA synthetase
VRLDDLVLSYSQLQDAAARVASLLSSLGVAPGDRVGVMLQNVPAFPIAFRGALAAGAIVVPMNPLLKNREVAHYVGDSEARVVFAWHQAVVEAAKGAAGTGAQVLEVDEPDLHTMLAGLAPAPSMADQAGDDDDAVILVYLGHHRHAQGRRAHAREPDPQRRALGCHHAERPPRRRTMGCLPLFHVFGLTCGLNATIAGGGTLTLLPRFDAGKALEIIGRDQVTIFEGVPTMYAAMLHHRAHANADTSSLRTCISGGAAMPLEILRGFEQTFGCMILEAYGLSETSPVASFNHPDRVRKPGSIGTPMQGVEMRVVDGEGASLPVGEVGEIAIQGHNVMKGYWGQARGDPGRLVPYR